MMPSLHVITHAVMVVVIATLVRKYMFATYQLEEMELVHQSCQHRLDDLEDHEESETVNIKETVIDADKNNNQYSEHHPQDESETISSDIPKFNNFKDIHTSVWCEGQTASARFCHFHNLCYFGQFQNFVFLHGDKSVKEGLSKIDANHILDLSTVEDHNNFYFSFVNILSEKFQSDAVQWINETSLLFARFKPDNLMHVLHDDIVPLKDTLNKISFEGGFDSFQVQLVFVDDWEENEFDILYQGFSDHHPISKQSLDNSNQVICFANSYVGISKTTLWYQYGFKTPQGPISDLKVESRHLFEVTNHFIDACPLNVESDLDYLVLLSRKENRLILNEEELMATITNENQVEIQSVSFETHTIEQMMCIVHKSKGIIGMHGSLMVLSAFLKPGGIVVELFPFAINPLHYTPYKTLASIEGMDLIYSSWANKLRTSTIMHPAVYPEYGGISHLSPSEREMILRQEEVPEHLCCSDPSWLLHIYQDTTVQCDEVASLVKSTLLESSSKLKKHDKTFYLLPSPVTDISCQRLPQNDKLSLNLTWAHPWNIPYINCTTINYEVWLQKVDSDDVRSFLLSNQTSYIIPDSIEPSDSYHIWVRCITENENKGVFGGFFNC